MSVEKSPFESWSSYWPFSGSVQRDLRYVRSAKSERFLEAVRKTLPARKDVMRKGSLWWRAQLGHSTYEREIDGDFFDEPCPFPSERMKPLRHSAVEGRVNPKGIPCLYVATDRDTAMSEVRPWVGSYVSVAQFQMQRDVEIVDCTRGHDKTPIFLEEPPPEKVTEANWFLIDKAFARPVLSSDTSADYAPTQVLAELFKSEGMGGLAYKSNFGKNGFNIALFDLDCAKLINCQLFKVKSVNIEFVDQPNGYSVK